MKQKTFFLSAFLVFILIVGYFTIQLHSRQDHYCRAYFDIDCDAEAQMICGGSDYIHILAGSWCVGSKCRGQWQIHCDMGDDFSYRGNVECDDWESPDCSNN